VLTIHHFLRGPLGNNVYLLVDEATGRAAIVDPGIDSEDILEFAAQRGWRIELILNTHAHFDHVYNNAWFAGQTGAPIALHADDLPLLRNLQDTCLRWGMPAPESSPEPAIELKHGEALDVLGTQVEVRHTPGHSPGQVCFFLRGGTGVLAHDDSTNGLSAGGTPASPNTPIAIVGDTLFHRGVGRWDLPGASWPQLEQSILEQLYTLPEETLVLPGHMDFTTIGEEKRFNPYVGSGARLIPKV